MHDAKISADNGAGILTKTFTNQDIRNIGSKNICATNVLRAGNKFVAALTLFLEGVRQNPEN